MRFCTYSLGHHGIVYGLRRRNTAGGEVTHDKLHFEVSLDCEATDGSVAKKRQQSSSEKSNIFLNANQSAFNNDKFIEIRR